MRVNADKADRFSFSESKAAGDAVRGVTVPMAVPVMHAIAEDIRNEGGSIFFAAMEG